MVVVPAGYYVIDLGAPLFRLRCSFTQLRIVGESGSVTARFYKIWCNLYKVIQIRVTFQRSNEFRPLLSCSIE